MSVGMNELVHPIRKRRATQAAEGLPRWRWTTAELVRLTEIGAFTAEDRFELIGGEIVPMSPTGRRHEVVAEKLERYFRGRETERFHIVNERQFNLDDDTYAEPDLLVRPAELLTVDVRGDTVLLVVEVGVTSLDYDLATKAQLYARYGVREYWVIDARTLSTRVHRRPGPDGYADKTEVAGTGLLTPLLVPELAVRLGDLRVG